MDFQKSGNGYWMLTNAAREVTRSRAMQQRYELAFGTPDPLMRAYTILSPVFFEDAIDDIISSAKKEGLNSISLESATSLLYSDFSRRNQFGGVYYNRRDTMQVLTEGFARINAAGISIKAQSANAYALPYVSHISNVPLYSSNYDVFDYDVPFFQIVLSGLIPYSTTPFNESPNLSELTLLALSTGTPVHYEFMYANPGDFNNSDYNKKFYSSFHGWFDDAAHRYHQSREVIGGVLNERIVGHNRLSRHEIETTFENGTTIYVNTATEEIRVEGGGTR